MRVSVPSSRPSAPSAPAAAATVGAGATARPALPEGKAHHVSTEALRRFTGRVLPRDQKLVATLVDCFDAIARRGDSVWPGFDWAGRCVVLNRQPSAKEPAAYHLVINHPALDASYEKLAYAKADVRMKPDALADASAFTFTPFHGVPSFFTNLATTLDPGITRQGQGVEPTLATASFCFHEMFHERQDSMARPPAPPSTPFIEYLDVKNATLAFMELDVVARYGLGTLPLDAAIFDLLAIRRQRTKEFAASVLNDQFFDALEGTPTFVEHNLLMAIGADAQARRFKEDMASRFAATESFDLLLRNKAYPFGFLVCHMLREKLGEISPDFFSKTPVGLLEQVCRFEPAALDQRFAELSRVADVARARATKVIDTQRTAMRRANDLYEPSRGRIVLPRIRGFSASDVTMFPNDLWMAKYAFYSADDTNTTTVHLVNDAALGVRFDDHFLQLLPDDATVAIDGRPPVPLAHGSDIGFSETLRIAAPSGFDLRLGGGGTLKTEPNRTLVFVPRESSSFSAPMRAVDASLRSPTALAELRRAKMPILDALDGQMSSNVPLA